MIRPYYLKIENFISYKEFEYYFSQGRSKIIVGRNLDDPSQKGNGSGKSGFNEAIVFGITGDYVRKVQVRDLVYNGEDNCKVNLILDNTLTNKRLHIHRVVYTSPNKSQECKVWLTNKDEEPDKNNLIEKSSVREYNKYILEYIDKTSDDLFQFFFLFRDGGYRPFLSLGDTEKKAIINRFSKADCVDNVDSLIDVDSKKLEKEINELNLKLRGVESKILVYQEQIDNFSISEIEDEKKEREKVLEEEFVKELEKLEVLKSEIVELENSILVSEGKEEEYKKKNYQDFTEDKKVLSEEIKSIKNKAEELKTSISLVGQDFEPELDLLDIQSLEISKKANELESQKVELNKELKATEEKIAKLNNKIVGAIECPKCSHEFNLQDKDFNIEEAKLELVSQEEEKLLYIQAIKEIDIEKEEIVKQQKDNKKSREGVESRIEEKQKLIRKEVTNTLNSTLELEEGLSLISTKEQKYTRDLQELVSSTKLLVQSKENKIKSQTLLETSISTLEKSIIEVSQEEIDDSVVKQAKSNIELQEIEKKKLVEEFDKKSLEKLNIDSWFSNFKNFKSELANKSIKSIQDHTNLFLQKMGSNITIEMEGYRQLSDKKLKEEINTLVYKDGVLEGSYGKFSAGERVRIDFCIILALQELINMNSVVYLDFLTTDEVLDACDSLGIELIIESLSNIERTVMITSQVDINSLEDSTLIFEKKNKVTRLVEKI